MARIALTSRLQKAITPNALRSYLAEFISTFFFVFTVVGSMMSSRKLMPDAASSDLASLVMVAVANALALSSATSTRQSPSAWRSEDTLVFSMPSATGFLR
ncbi:hypothetical protein ACFX1X_001752 [Malus domestica]